MRLPKLYPILDTATLARRSFPVTEAAAAMLEGGARILQLRHKGHFSRRVFEQAEQIGELCRRYGALWVIDDRADIAKLLGAALHLGQDDLPPKSARVILGGEAIIGFSTHNAEQMRQAETEPVDYLAIGPIFTTGSKENPDPVVGIDKLREWNRLTRRPLAAIGGITRGNAARVIEAGADSVAVISDLLPAELTGESIRERIREWVQLLQDRPED